MVLGVPPWTKLDHLYQPLHCGGPGCPKLEVRLPLLLLLTYMSGSYSRNEYTLAAAHYLMSERSPTSEGGSVLHHVLPWGLSVAVLPSDKHLEAPRHVEGDVMALLQSDTLVAAIDAAMFDRIHSCAVILYNIDTQSRVGFSMSYAVLDSEPAVSETMARLLLWHALRNWSSRLWAATYCASALWRMYTRLPRKETIMAAIFRSLAPVLQQVQVHELWVEA